MVTGLAGEGEGLENILNSQNLLDFKVNIFFCTHCIAKFSNSIEPYPIIPYRNLNKANLEKCAEDVRSGAGCEDEGEEGAEASVKNSRTDISHGLDSSQV